MRLFKNICIIIIALERLVEIVSIRDRKIGLKVASGMVLGVAIIATLTYKIPQLWNRPAESDQSTATESNETVVSGNLIKTYDFGQIEKTYTGTYITDSGISGLTLRIHSYEKHTGNLSAELNFYPHSSNPGTASGKYEMKGSFIRQTPEGEIEFALSGVKWIENPGQQEMIDCFISIDQSRNHITSDTYQISLTSYYSDVVFDFSETAERYLGKIGYKYWDREYGKKHHDPCADWIVSELLYAGYQESDIIQDEFQVRTTTMKTKKGKNLIVKIKGADPTKQIIVGAHYDGYGATDNGSGVALLLATACGLVNETPDVNVVCVFFDQELPGMIGSGHYVSSMTDQEIKNTLFMINVDCIAAGDYCNVYGGVTKGQTVERTEGYELAVGRAEQLGFNVYRTADLEGYYQAHGAGPEIEENTLYTNPWTVEYPNPDQEVESISPTTIAWSDHAPFMNLVPYICFQASNWYVGLYDGMYDTADTSLGLNGKMMGTGFDLWSTLEEKLPGRALSHLKIYSPLLSSLMLHPYS